MRQVKKEEEGVVIALEGKIAKVRASRHSDCESCGACPGDKATVLDVYNQVDAKLGQRVMITIPEANMVKAAFIVYVLPLITTFIGFLIGVWLSQKYGFPALFTEVCTSIVGFVVAIIYIKYFDRSMSKTATMPLITDILSK